MLRLGRGCLRGLLALGERQDGRGRRGSKRALRARMLGLGLGWAPGQGPVGGGRLKVKRGGEGRFGMGAGHRRGGGRREVPGGLLALLLAAL